MNADDDPFVTDLLRTVNISADSLCTTLSTDEYQSKKCGNLERAPAIWTYNVTLTLLKLYEMKLQMLETPKKKTGIWNAVSQSLKDYNVEVSPDQVRWKINALTKKYKQCVDTGQYIKFKYFQEMDNIYAQYHVDEFIHKKKCKQSIQETSMKINRESKGMIDLRKARLARRLESERTQNKIKIEKQWLKYLHEKEENKLLQDEMVERVLKLKEEELELFKQNLEFKESIESRKLHIKEEEYDRMLIIEKEKCEILQQILENRVI